MCFIENILLHCWLLITISISFSNRWCLSSFIKQGCREVQQQIRDLRQEDCTTWSRFKIFVWKCNRNQRASSGVIRQSPEIHEWFRRWFCVCLSSLCYFKSPLKASADLEVQLVQLNHCDGVYSNYWNTLLRNLKLSSYISFYV